MKLKRESLKTIPSEIRIKKKRDIPSRTKALFLSPKDIRAKKKGRKKGNIPLWGFSQGKEYQKKSSRYVSISVLRLKKEIWRNQGGQEPERVRKKTVLKRRPTPDIRYQIKNNNLSYDRDIGKGGAGERQGLVRG